MWQRFSLELREVISAACAKAESNDSFPLTCRDLLSGIEAQSGTGSSILLYLGVERGAALDALNDSGCAETLNPAYGSILTKEAREVVDRAYEISADLDDNYIGAEHVVLALVESQDRTDVATALNALGATWESCGKALVTLQKHRTAAPKGVEAPELVGRRAIRGLAATAQRAAQVVLGTVANRPDFSPLLLSRKKALDDPYPMYSRQRHKGIYFDDLVNQWVVTSYEDVLSAIAEPRLSQRIFEPKAWNYDRVPEKIAREFRTLHTSIARQMLFLDSPDHLPLRMSVARRFTPRVLENIRNVIQQVADELIGAVKDRGLMEIVSELAIPFPLTIIMRMLGVPATEFKRCKKWSYDYFLYLNLEPSMAIELEALRSVRDAEAYFRALLPERRQNPGDDLVSVFLQPDPSGECLSDDDVVSNSLLLLATGHENTTRLIGAGIATLLQNPAQFNTLQEDLSLIDPAVEELIRYISPLQWTLRYVAEDFNWRGHQLKEGQSMRMGLGSANRDPAQFSEPDTLNIRRLENRHLAFGQGTHYCLGAALTRLEVQVLLRTIVTSFPRLRLAGQPEWMDLGITFRGVEALKVRWD